MTHTIDPTALADRLAAGHAVTVLDVRDDASFTVEGPGVTLRHVPAAAALADPSALAAALDGSEAVVVCARGRTAVTVAEALRAGGAEALVLEGGLRGWLGALQAHPVELGVPGLEVLQVQRPGRGCLSYVLAAGGEALVVDPAPDAAFYAAQAERLGARITDVLDTHLHADHLSGARALARRTGATLWLPALALARGVADPERFMPVEDGDVLLLGGVEIRVLALPGHTTDMTGLLVARRALLSGDSLFADGLARPDLERGDAVGSRVMARGLHATLHDRIGPLADDVVLLPGHGHPGVRSEALAPTLGEVRRTVGELALADPEAFADEILTAMPPRPANFEAVIAVNAGTRPFDPELESGANSCATR
jgi:glyoxylase-like metal-dependent hydrolase (beta-lactamase superfamily II)/rhodanese-related sulfurtransferase